mmetsp:Transcript_2872/g.6727  ORF Transcript_2872/g.6727 Transcript_2872/m.6727 type:complete len:425 (+) Transcript_2872:902-2176(+)
MRGTLPTKDEKETVGRRHAVRAAGGRAVAVGGRDPPPPVLRVEGVSQTDDGDVLLFGNEGREILAGIAADGPQRVEQYRRPRSRRVGDGEVLRRDGHIGDAAQPESVDKHPKHIVLVGDHLDEVPPAGAVPSHSVHAAPIDGDDVLVRVEPLARLRVDPDGHCGAPTLEAQQVLPHVGKPLVIEGEVQVELPRHVNLEGRRLAWVEESRGGGEVARVHMGRVAKVADHIKDLLGTVRPAGPRVAKVHAHAVLGAADEEHRLRRPAARHRQHDVGQGGVGGVVREADVPAVVPDARVRRVQGHPDDICVSLGEGHSAEVQEEPVGVLVKHIELVAVGPVAIDAAKEVPVVAKHRRCTAVHRPGPVSRSRDDRVRQAWADDCQGVARGRDIAVHAPVDREGRRLAVAHKQEDICAIPVVQQPTELK